MWSAASSRKIGTMVRPTDDTLEGYPLQTATDPAMSHALGATLAAPLPAMVAEGSGDAPFGGALRGTNASVLPRVELGERGARLMPGDGRRYEPLKTIGRGGMGEVALVEDRDIGRNVAVKRLLDDSQAPAAVARFVDEVRTIGRLEHPNIVPIHDVGVDEDGQLFFVMKYVDGETLESVITRIRAGDETTRRAYDATRCTEVFIGILRALEVAHARGIIHRDVKPANVMIGRFGEVVLMDWGVARPVSGPPEATVEPLAETLGDRASSTHSGALIGTPLYMSPEQARGANDALDGRSDLYSACVLFHELLNGGHHRHEHAPSLAALLLAIQTTVPPAVSRVFDHHGEVGPEYGHFLRRGLAIDPGERWQSASDMIAELHLIIDGRFRIQCPATLTKRATRAVGHFVDRQPGPAVLVAALTVIGVLALLANAVVDLVL